MSGQIGVILSGAGVYDGTETHEVAAACVAITRHGKTPVFYAPDKPLFHEVNHVTGESSSDTKRNVLIESARIARGKVQPLSELTADSVEAIVVPGGFGAAKNLCDFAVSSEPVVDPDMERVIEEFHKAGKPMAFCCIAPVLPAMVLSNKMGIQIKITLGKKEGSEWPHGGVIDKVYNMSANVEEMSVNEVCIDGDNKIVSTPAFMYNGLFHEIHDGVIKMVDELIAML